MDHPLLKFCNSEAQRQAIIATKVKGLSQVEAALKLGISRSALRDRLSTVNSLAARRGYSPDNDWHHPVPDGHKIKGVSTFYDQKAGRCASGSKARLMKSGSLRYLLRG